jgi:hypothetical protein
LVRIFRKVTIFVITYSIISFDKEASNDGKIPDDSRVPGRVRGGQGYVAAVNDPGHYE